MSTYSLPEYSCTHLDVIHYMPALHWLQAAPSNFVDCIVTSPPYYGLRDYGIEGQIGLEDTPEAYVTRLVELFREARRVLKNDGTLWLNLGDSYSANVGGKSDLSRGQFTKHRVKGYEYHIQANRNGGTGLPPKNLIGIPWRVAFALQADGWCLRSDIIWHKPNPLPESVTDRPTRSHDYLFLLSKNQQYYYDAEAIAEPCSESTHNRIGQDLINQIGTKRSNGGKKSNGNLKAVIKGSTALVNAGINPKAAMMEHGSSRQNKNFANAICLPVLYRNKRDVWTIPTQGFKGAHFATFPMTLVETCILAGCPTGGIVCDLFMGSGTTALVAQRLGRHFIGCDLNPEYVAMARQRLYYAGDDHRMIEEQKDRVMQLALFDEEKEPA